MPSLDSQQTIYLNSGSHIADEKRYTHRSISAKGSGKRELVGQKLNDPVKFNKLMLLGVQSSVIVKFGVLMGNRENDGLFFNC